MQRTADRDLLRLLHDLEGVVKSRPPRGILRRRYDTTAFFQTVAASVIRIFRKGGYEERSPGHRKAWLRTIRDRKMNRAIRRKLKDGQVRFANVEGPEPSRATEDPAHAAAEAEQRLRLQQALARLEPEARWVIEELLFHSRTQQDLAQELGLSVRTIRRFYARARDSLRRMLEEP